MRHLLSALAITIASLSVPAQAEWVERDYQDFNTHHNDMIELTYTGLSEHQFVKLNFDLFILNSWDGNTSQPADPERGNDYWGFTIGDGTNTLHSIEYTFSNFRPDTAETNPDRSWDFYAAGDNYLGLYNQYGIRVFENYNDGFVFSHSGDTLTLSFYARDLYGIDESWIVDDLVIATDDSSIVLEGMGNLQDVPVSYAGLFSLALLGVSRRFCRRTTRKTFQNR